MISDEKTPATNVWDDEEEPVLGYLYTHCDCPHCGEANEYEGDRQHETVSCTACGRDFQIGEMR